VPPAAIALGRVLVLAACVVVVTGTVVTGTGPHSGGTPEDEVERFDFYIPHVARVHGTSVMVFLGLVVVTWYVLWRCRATPSVNTRLAVLLAVLVAQAGVGYAQYFNDIPPLLVGIHIAGATAVWAAVIAFYLGLFTRDEPSERPAPEPSDLAGVAAALR
jgi:cytochrome c oxidase assembly protein subunit 15